MRMLLAAITMDGRRGVPNDSEFAGLIGDPVQLFGLPIGVIETVVVVDGMIRGDVRLSREFEMLLHERL